MIPRVPMARLLSPYVGPIRSLQAMASFPDQPPLPSFVVETANLKQIHGCRLGMVRGGTLHYTPDEAIAASIGEAVERYCGAAIPEGLVTGTAADLGAAAVAPERFALFHPSQYAAATFPFHPFLPTTRVRWTRGVGVVTGVAVYLPAQLVYLGADVAPDETSDEAPIGYATSSGMACGPTPDDAILTGLLELIERDAVMLTWYQRRSPPRLSWRSDPHLTAVEQRCFAPTGLDYVCLNLSDFVQVPTVLAVVRGKSVGLAVGAASGITPQDAWLKAMREVFATYAWADRLRHTMPPISPERLDRVQRFSDHVRFYAEPQNCSFAAFLWQSTEEQDIEELPAVLEATTAQQIVAVVRRLAAVGASVYAVDLTTEDVRRVGLHVWKAVSPELQPLDVGYDRRFLGGTRLLTLAGRHRERGVALPSDLNPWPHPFP